EGSGGPAKPGTAGVKLSVEVKPFVPKHVVAVAWSEPSEACVFPRYLTTHYPFVQEPSLDKCLFSNYFLSAPGVLVFLTSVFLVLHTICSLVKRLECF
uniref:Uncharacterized protein n=1 Tax=Calidris pygmaea TaxID=425635 RepID=A0A8C3KHQ3_9CHAR